MARTPEQPFDPRDIPYGTYFLGLVIVAMIALYTFGGTLLRFIGATTQTSTEFSSQSGCPDIGDECNDGSFYAGLSPDGDVHMYVAAVSTELYGDWSTSNSIYNGINSTTDGDGNTAALVALVNADAPYIAAQYCHDLDAHGHTDWYLPARDELDLLYNSGAPIAGVEEAGGPNDSYWSSTEASAASAVRQWFDDGDANSQSKGVDMNIRCVRKGISAKVTVASTPSIPELDQGLVGHWTFDGPDVDWSSTTAEIRDRTGNIDLDAVGTLGVDSPVIGKLGQGLLFDGVYDHLHVLTNEFDNPPELSLSAWIKPNNNNTDMMIAVKGTGSSFPSDGWLWLIDQANYISFRAGYSSGSGYINANTADDVIQREQWNHVVATWDGSTDASNIKLYVNGVLQANATEVDGVGSREAEVNFIYVGRSAGGSYDFGGEMDDLRFYDRALSADEVQRLYRLGEGTKISTTIKSPGSPLEQGLVGHWTFDGPDVRWQDSSSEIKDVSGNGNHGDAQGGMNVDSPTFGKLGQAMEFDGVSDGIDLSSVDLSVVAPTAGTLCAWHKPSRPYNDSSRQWVINRQGSSDSEFQMGNYSNNNLYFGFVTNGRYQVAATAQTWPQNEWVHYCATWGGTETAGWVNGNKLGTGSFNGSASANSKLAIAHQQSESFYEGVVDDVRIYDRVLSVKEIEMLYELGR